MLTSRSSYSLVCSTMNMPGIAVYIDRPPNQAFLLTWGRAPDAWWGCVQFRHRVTSAAGLAELPVAVWLPAASITKPGWSAALELPRLHLDLDRTKWPAPLGWPSWYAGAWPAGPLTLPPGCEPVTGPAWRRRQ